MFINHKKDYLVEIQIDTDILYYNGNSSQSQGLNITGRIILKTFKESASKSPIVLNMSFISKLHIVSNGLFSPDYDQILFKQDLQFKTVSENSSMPFDIKLPGYLPANIKLNNFNISNELIIYEKNLIREKTLASKNIKIYRLCHFNPDNIMAHNLSNSNKLTQINGEVEDVGIFNILYSDTISGFSDPISINLNIESDHKLRVTSIVYSTRQTVCLDYYYKNGVIGQPQYNHQLSTYQAYSIDENELCSISSRNINKASNYVFRSKFQPTSQDQIELSQYSSQNQEYSIYHYILMQITLFDLENRQLFNRLIKLPITIQPKIN